MAIPRFFLEYFQELLLLIPLLVITIVVVQYFATEHFTSLPTRSRLKEAADVSKYL